MNIREEMINRMSRILNRFSRKLKIAVYLPMIMAELKSQGDAMEFRKIYKLCSSVKLEIQTARNNGSREISSLEEEPFDLKSQCAVVLQDLIGYEEDILLVVKENLGLILPSYVNTLNHVELLQQIVDLQMKTTPKQLREREIQLRNAGVLIVRAQDEIKKLEESIDEETSKHNDTIKKYKDEVDELNLVIDNIRNRHRVQLEREMDRYETKLRGLRDDITEDERNLDVRLYANEELMEMFMRANLEREKSLRRRCKRAEEEYLSAQGDYDRDLNKLNELKETLEIQLRVTKNHLEILKNEYDVQSVLFTNLKKERELAMMQAFAEQLDNFEKNRAARIIQRTWRAYHERVSAKKKKKKKNK